MEQKYSSEANRDLHITLGQAEIAVDADASIYS
jgi:hypothetical protein